MTRNLKRIKAHWKHIFNSKPIYDVMNKNKTKKMTLYLIYYEQSAEKINDKL